MGQSTRREFLRRTGQAGIALGLGSNLGALAGCDSVSSASGRYDVIIIGGGTAGTIVAAKLQAASGGRKRILIIEAGGPTAASIGGTDYPVWLPPDRNDLTIFDVPGQYSQIPFTPAGAPYQLTETSFTYQGIGLGGNSQFNGMLFQTNPPLVFNRSWPGGWGWKDLAPYFKRIRQNIPVTNTPSTNGIPQNTGPAEIVHPLYESMGWVEGDTSRPFPEEGVFSRPYVATEDGRRAGPVSGYFEEVDPGGVPVEGLEILEFTKADLIEFDGRGRAEAVHYTKRGALDQKLPGEPGTARLKKGGLLVLAAGALVTPRLLLLSGVGPKGREAEIFPGQSPAPFTIDNQRVGVGLFDHVMTLVAYNYDGQIPYQAYNYGNYAGNEADLQAYLENGRGPYAQYQPVSILNYRYNSDVPNVEVFLNPNGAGPSDGPYYGPNTLSAFVMLLNPKARGLVTLDENGNVRFPNIYMPPDTVEGQEDIELMTQAVFDLIQLFEEDPGLSIAFGPGSPSHPDLDPDNIEDIRTYVTSPSPVDNVYYSRLIINHWGGTARLADGPGGVDPETLILRGTENVAVVDASLIPTIVTGHPVGTIMAVADRAGDILAARIG
ncbi:MAG: GMC family oxidoreductase N-terminal domain-containing protein [Thermodesulfobacteriota bacterium]